MFVLILGVVVFCVAFFVHDSEIGDAFGSTV